MTAQELVDYLRRDVLRDRALPYLWSDELLLMYLNEAVTKFSRATYSSSVASNYDVSLAADQAEYLLTDNVLWVASARIDGVSHDLGNYTHRIIPDHLLSTTGTPAIFTMDEEVSLLRVYPVPDAPYTLRVRAAVLPANMTTLDQTPAVRAQYHLDLADWVVYRCLANNEVEGKNEKLALVYEGRWGKLISEARRDVYRIRMGNNPHARQNWTGKR